MIKRRMDKKQQVLDSDKLQLNSQVYFSLLVLQTLNLLTLVAQLHIAYISFAVLALVIQFSAHLKLKDKRLGRIAQSPSDSSAGAVKLKSTSVAKSAVSLLRSHFYPAPRILPSWFILLVAIAGSISLAIFGRELGLLMSMVHLLCLAYSLKVFEIPKRKDLYQLVMLGVFIATSSLIFIQSVYFSIAVIVLVFANFIVLFSFFSASSPLKQQSKMLAKLVVYSIPFAILLFIGFPKLAPFWQVPNVESAKVGLSDKVKIGDIAKLALSDELAFRVTFNDAIPQHSQQYWRAMVLDDFDGSTWQQAKAVRPSTLAQRMRDQRNVDINVDVQGPSISYQVIAEPSFQSWLFALDYATNEQAIIGQRTDYALYYHGIVNKTLSYNVTSYPEAILAKNLASTQREINLTIPVNSNPRLTAKGQQLRSEFLDHNQLINHVLSEFNQQEYFYTLQPPGLSGSTLDQFYFDTKSGFCEHYASAFTYLMRASGIPARIVTGYLGSEINPKGNYLSVYQRNAHAWSEVWLEGQGWVRVDPTAAVDPERVDSGFSNSLMQDVSDLSTGLFSMRSVKAMWLYNQLKQQLEALDYQWTRWVIGYTDSRQNQVMKNIISALNSLKSVFYLAVAALCLVFLTVLIKLIRVKKVAQSEWQTTYLILLSMLEKQQLVKDKSMTAMQFANVVAEQRPDISTLFTQLSRYYCQLEYQQPLDNKSEVIAKLDECYRHLRWQIWRTHFKIK